MKVLLIGLLTLTSLASFAQNSSKNELCLGKAYEEIMNTEELKAKIENLLADKQYKEVNKISLKAGELAALACKK